MTEADSTTGGTVSSNQEQAKQMFWRFACSRFHLTRDGYLDQYEQYGPTGEDEKRWRREYIEHWSARLSSIDTEPIDKLSHAHAFEALPELIRHADGGDDYVRLWYANAIWQVASSHCQGRHAMGSPRRGGRASCCVQRRQTCGVAVSIWRDLIASPAGIEPENRKHIRPHVRSLNASTPEQYVSNYASNQLKRARKELETEREAARSSLVKWIFGVSMVVVLAILVAADVGQMPRPDWLTPRKLGSWGIVGALLLAIISLSGQLLIRLWHGLKTEKHASWDGDERWPEQIMTRGQSKLARALDLPLAAGLGLVTGCLLGWLAISIFS